MHELYILHGPITWPFNTRTLIAHTYQPFDCAATTNRYDDNTILVKNININVMRKMIVEISQEHIQKKRKKQTSLSMSIFLSLSHSRAFAMQKGDGGTSSPENEPKVYHHESF